MLPPARTSPPPEPGAPAGAARYWQARLSAHPGLEGVGYLGLGRHYNAWLYRVRRRVFLQTMRSLDLPFATVRVLDVGCGTGFYIERFKELGVRDLVGVDIATAAVARLAARFPDDTFIELDISTGLGPLAGRTFDIVSAFDVLFHIVDDAAFERAVGHMASLLQPGGLLVLSDNLLPGPTVRTAHQASRGEADYLRVLAGAGLEVRLRRPMFCLMNYPVAARSDRARRVWRAVAARIGGHETLGFLVGAGLYPVEIACLCRLRHAPSTELVVCVKR